MKYEINEASPRHKETMHIIDLVSKALGIGMATLLGKKRQRNIVDARRVCYVLLDQKLLLQLPDSYRKQLQEEDCLREN